jgi:hypothetical protein
MMQLIALFQEQGFHITFASPAQDTDFMVDLVCITFKSIFIELG